MWAFSTFSVRRFWNTRSKKNENQPTPVEICELPPRRGDCMTINTDCEAFPLLPLLQRIFQIYWRVKAKVLSSMSWSLTKPRHKSKHFFRNAKHCELIFLFLHKIKDRKRNVQVLFCPFHEREEELQNRRNLKNDLLTSLIGRLAQCLWGLTIGRSILQTSLRGPLDLPIFTKYN